MNAFRRLKRYLGLERSLSGAAVAWLSGRDYDAGTGVLVSAGSDSSMVYACVSLIAETVSSVPVRLVSLAGAPVTGSSGEVDSPVLIRPHPQLTRTEFIERIVWWYLLRGEVFLIPDREKKTVSVIGPVGMTEIVENRELAGWQCTIASPKEPVGPGVFLPGEVVQMKTANPYSWYRGLSPLSAAWVAAQTDYAASEFMKGAMLNNADTGLIVSSKEPVSQETREQILAALRERKRRPGAADQPLFLNGVSVDKPTVSAADLNLLGTRKFSRQEICAVYKVPQELLGYSEDSNRSVGESVRLNFMENRIAPLCAKIGEKLTELVGIMGLEAPGRVELAVSEHPVMQAARLERVEAGKKLFEMGVSFDRINAALGLGI